MEYGSKDENLDRASSVYENKLYSFTDVDTGYQYVRVLHLDNDNDIKIDIDLTDDVWEQDRGGNSTKLKGGIT